LPVTFIYYVGYRHIVYRHKWLIKMENEVKRIFLKFWILKIIGDKPTHGYEIIQEIDRKTGGRWTPSEEADRRKIYSITPKGRAALEQMIVKWREQIRDIALFLDAIMEENSEDAEFSEQRGEIR
jgi:DNA-binding PadR family transcriptional regulator